VFITANVAAWPIARSKAAEYIITPSTMQFKCNERYLIRLPVPKPISRTLETSLMSDEIIP